MRTLALALLMGLAACAGSGARDPAGDMSSTTGPKADGPHDRTTSRRCTGRGGAAGDSDNPITVGATGRRYLLHVPPSYDPTIPMPLVVGYHGVTFTPEQMRDATHFDEVADQRGFLVAYPAGLYASWNAGTCCGGALAGKVDDVAFSRALLDEVTGTYCVDDQQIFATGFSNGGFMTHRVGCELADRYAAIGVVSGQESLAACAPGRPVPVVQLHGTADPLVPYLGNPLLGFPSTAQTIAGWAMRDGCADPPTTIGVEGSVTCVRHGGCAEDAEVILCTNEGGAHDWIGGGTLWTSAGPPPGFVTTLYFADFFGRHPRP